MLSRLTEKTGRTSEDGRTARSLETIELTQPIAQTNGTSRTYFTCRRCSRFMALDRNRYNRPSHHRDNADKIGRIDQIPTDVQSNSSRQPKLWQDNPETRCS